MNIAHVVAYVSADGAYGGPTSVAFAQLEELQRTGDNCTLFAGWDGVANRTSNVDLKLFPTKRLLGKRSFAAIYSVPLLRSLWKNAKRYDVIHIHLARDLLTTPAALIALLRRKPLVVQTHGMIVEDKRLPARILDALFIKPILKRAKSQIVLTEAEAASAHALAPNRTNVVRLDNGVPAQSARAHFSDEPTVLFCARLHKRKRPVAFVEMAAALKAAGSSARFEIAGPDEGEAAAVRDAIDSAALSESVKLLEPLDPGSVVAKFAESQVFVLPSINEPFPMTVLEAMSLGLPTVITESNGLAAALREVGPYLVTNGEPEQLAAAVQKLEDENEWSLVSTALAALAESRFSIRVVAERLAELYER